MNRRLAVLVLLIFSFPLFAHAQSLGEVARVVRAERQQSGAPHAKVITNDDLAPVTEKAPPPAEEASGTAPAPDGKDAAAPKETADAAKPAEGAKQEGEASAEPAKDKKTELKKKDPAKEREERELEAQKRSDEINKRYTDRITALHEQINAAQAQMTKLQIQQVESTNEFKRSVGMSPTLNEYEAQQRRFNEQIEVQRSLITNLNLELDDAREAARHAGVPHALDY